ncbi:hypothetical protein NW762_014645 [Fusarium torreyae]|uniref:Uncharacterized protein n=1 Tax=Fusarium torreyae TaxID=1237075 RepID=A0A9W8RJX0_9HYPO|nr:hypothetical protein NW762_014645 [Fusarium torreyae]
MTDAALGRVVDQFSLPLSSGDYKRVISMLSPDVVLEDLALRTRIDGQRAVEIYFRRAATLLLYGTGSTVNHVVGNAKGGAYEWNSEPDLAGLNGMTAIELDGDHIITRLTCIRNTFSVGNDTMEMLAKLSIES